MLTKLNVETTLNAELVDRLCYTKHRKSITNNSRNDTSRKTMIT